MTIIKKGWCYPENHGNTSRHKPRPRSRHRYTHRHRPHSHRARPRPSAIGEGKKKGKEERQHLLALGKKSADFLKSLRMKRHVPSYDKSEEKMYKSVYEKLASPNRIRIRIRIRIPIPIPIPIPRQRKKNCHTAEKEDGPF
jgi:hypothetical protein